MNASIAGLVAVLIAVFWALGAYNRLIGLRAAVAQHLQTLLELWQSQAQMVCTRLAPYEPGEDIGSRWITLDEETQRWRALAVSARQFMACCDTLQKPTQRLPNRDDAAAVRAARLIFEANWQHLRDAHADLAGAAVPVDLQLLWSQHELLLKDRLESHAQAVDAYHTAIRQFPASMMAWAFRFEQTGQLIQPPANPVISS
jgi:LemA protein